MITGGETADPADCRPRCGRLPGARLLNAYGLTETTITSALFDVERRLRDDLDPAGPVPGRPAGRARAGHGPGREAEPVPAGTTGEVYIGGCGVARGYLGRPALTAERFLPDPAGAPGGRMYRTGTWAAGWPDGSLEVAGRVDRQLKVRGFRVEPGEIESVLAGHPDIDQVSVVAVERAAPATPAWSPTTRRRPAAARPAHHPPAASLRRYLLDRLPGYMIPAAFIARQELHAGPRPPGRARGRRGTRARRAANADEAGLSALWARLLGRDHVGLDDDFFALGGNSLLAAEMLAHARVMFGIAADCGAPAHPLPAARPHAARVRPRRRWPTPARAKLADGRRPGRGRLRRGGRGSAIRVRQDRPDRCQCAPGGRTGADPGEVLLTGATGFLGAHLLSELLAATGARVRCLVRARDAAHAPARIGRRPAATSCRAARRPRRAAARRPRQAAARAFPGANSASSPRGIDVIYHVGATVNFIYPYQELRAANVTGTREVIRLAGLYRGIPRALRLHHRGARGPRRGRRPRGDRGNAARASRAAAHGLRRDEVRGGGAAAERGPGGPAGRDLPAAGHRRQRAHRRRGAPRPRCAR